MRRNNHYIVRTRGPRVGVTFRMAMLAAVALGLVGLGAYFCFSSTFATRFPLACNIPAFPTIAEDAVSCGPPGDVPAVVKEDAEGTGCSQEITDLTGQGDTLVSLLTIHLSDPATAKQVAESLSSVIRAEVEQLRFSEHTILQPSRRYSVTLDARGKFLKATLELDPARVFHAVQEGDGIRSWKERVVLDYKVETVTIPVRGTLSQSVLDAGEGMELVAKLISVFQWDIDFQSESVSGDTCKVLFERRYADDRPSGYGRILCAIYNGRRTGRKVAVLFKDKESKDTYFDENGVQLRKNILRTPLRVMRKTSGYGMRIHPIDGRRHMHKGVDYAAPTGTPVWAVASGVVTFAGWKKGYGKFVSIKHGNGYESRYGHLHSFRVRQGQRVKQRQCIGLVGRTGYATGPHLHFELLTGTRHVNPLSVRYVKNFETVPSDLKPRFETVVQERLLSLESIVIGRRDTPSPSSRLY
ncbi:MAG: M23 family metallopeptidase [Desulfomonilaceae bacterium]|nr:M23 family metallopeptidase [Desulfomonilaceae bacterium]